jgi:hypothetical protein
MKSSFEIPRLDTTSPAVSTREPAPNNTPFGFTRNTRPFELRAPRICDGKIVGRKFKARL